MESNGGGGYKDEGWKVVENMKTKARNVRGTQRKGRVLGRSKNIKLLFH